MNYSNYVSLDLETTGLDVNTCDITEIAMIKVRDGEIVDRMETFVYTPLDISEHISYLTGITAKDVEHSPDFIELVPKVQEFIGDDPLMGHNIWFDWNFLTEKGVKLEKNQLWDTYTMSNILYPELPSHSLETNTKYFNIPHEDSHRAMADVMACHELWKILIDTFPKISEGQRKKIKELEKKSKWPLMSYFTQDKKTAKKEVELQKMDHYQPKASESIDISDRKDHLFVHCPGLEPIDVALGLKTAKKTLIICGYDHTLDKVRQAFPEAYCLQAPYSYLSEKKVAELWKKKELEDGESLILLKTILNPEADCRDDLSLSHPEKMIWNDINLSDDEIEDPDSPFQKAYQNCLQSDQVVTKHFYVLNDLEFVANFDQLIILEPQLFEANATHALGKRLDIDSWLRQTSDDDWKRKGEYLFAQIDKLGKSIAPASQYPEHLILTELVTSSNEFARLKTAIAELLPETKDEKLLSFLKYYQAFFTTNDASWIRWITVDPRRGVSLNLAPLSVKSLLRKNIFDKVSCIIVSDTAGGYEYLPEMEVQELGKGLDVKVELPDIDFQGRSRDADNQSIISYLADKLPTLKGKTGVVFSSKTALKRYFFDLVKVVPDEIGMFGEDISGGTSKLRDRYLADEHGDKVIFMTYRNMRSFATEVLDFDQILLQSFPFDPPGFPVHQARAEQYDNAFIGYAVPRTQQNLLEIITNFTMRDVEKNLYVLDRRAVEKDYGSDILGVI